MPQPWAGLALRADPQAARRRCPDPTVWGLRRRSPPGNSRSRKRADCEDPFPLKPGSGLRMDFSEGWIKDSKWPFRPRLTNLNYLESWPNFFRKFQTGKNRATRPKRNWASLSQLLTDSIFFLPLGWTHLIFFSSVAVLSEQQSSQWDASAQISKSGFGVSDPGEPKKNRNRPTDAGSGWSQASCLEVIAQDKLNIF